MDEQDHRKVRAEDIGPGLFHEFADLEKANLRGVNLSGAHLRLANLEGANLEDANLSGTMLEMANLRGARLIQANLTRAILNKASMAGADLRSANLSGAYLVAADLTGAQLERGNLHAAILRGACLNGVDLRPFGAGLALDDNDIEGAVFGPRSRVPWLVLRRRYTGSAMAFHLIFLVVALGPYVLRVLRTYRGDFEQGLEDAIPESAPEWATRWLRNIIEARQARLVSELRVSVLLGLNVGFWTATSSVVLLSYNALRFLGTWWLSQVRESVAGTHRSPRKKDYWLAWLIHRRFMRWAELAALSLGAWRALQWLLTEVRVMPLE